MLLSSPSVDTSQTIAHAFYAYLSNGGVDPGHHHIIVFDTELTIPEMGTTNIQEHVWSELKGFMFFLIQSL